MHRTWPVGCEANWPPGTRRDVVQSATALRVGVDAAGRSRAVDLRCEVPQLLRLTEGAPAHPGALQVHLVGGAAGPLGGDRWDFDLSLAAGAQVRLRSVAASLAQPDPHGRPSQARVRVRLDQGAVLDAWPEPIVSVRGSHHTLDVALDVAADAGVRWVDEVVLGRHGEPSGTVVIRQRLEHDGRVVVAQELQLGGDRDGGSYGRHGPYRVVATAVGRFDGASAVEVQPQGRAVRCAVGDGWATWSAVGHSHMAVRQLLGLLGLDR